jgi:hypothetical protein
MKYHSHIGLFAAGHRRVRSPMQGRRGVGARSYLNALLGPAGSASDISTTYPGKMNALTGDISRRNENALAGPIHGRLSLGRNSRTQHGMEETQDALKSDRLWMLATVASGAEPLPRAMDGGPGYTPSLRAPSTDGSHGNGMPSSGAESRTMKELAQLLTDIYDSAKEEAIEFWGKTGPKWLPKVINRADLIWSILGDPRTLDDPEYGNPASAELWRDPPPHRQRLWFRQGR